MVFIVERTRPGGTGLGRIGGMTNSSLKRSRKSGLARGVGGGPLVVLSLESEAELWDLVLNLSTISSSLPVRLLEEVGCPISALNLDVTCMAVYPELEL